jgi:hypothetical protein
MSTRIIKNEDALDNAGMTASLLCAAHCALLPIVVTLLPLVGLSFLAHETTEWMLLGLSAALGMSSLCLGFRQHRSRRALAVLSAGLALLAGGHMVEHLEVGEFGVALVVLGGLTVAAAHWVNRRLCLACRVCHDEENGSCRGHNG